MEDTRDRENDPILRWFDGFHLRTELRPIIEEFEKMARHIVRNMPPSPERTVALRKLLESKDAAVRATVSMIENNPTNKAEK